MTSLPPGIRMNAENLILAGVWQGTVKPPMDAILSKVLDKISDFRNNGISVQLANCQKKVYAQVVLSVFDLPARAIATSFVQFNGNYSCLYCYDKGNHTSHRHLFFPDEKHKPRSQESILEDAKKAKERGLPVKVSQSCLHILI